MTVSTYVVLALAVVAVALLVARQRALRKELGAARGEASSARTAAEEADRLRQEREASSSAELAAATARTAAVEEAMGRQATEAEARLAELRASSEQRIDELERSLRRTEDELRRVSGTAAARAGEVEAAQARAAELEAAAAAGRSELQATAARVTALEAELAARPSAPTRHARPDPPLAPQEGDAAWSLLLARIERQWAELVNAGPDERGVVDGPRGEQLTQAAGRELERLREEVGVETAMTVTGPVDAGHAVTTLLVVGEAAALLASRSERVSVELGGRTVVTGQEWAGDDDSRRRLDDLVGAAAVAGRPAVVEPDGGAVRVVIG